MDSTRTGAGFSGPRQAHAPYTPALCWNSRKFHGGEGECAAADVELAVFLVVGDGEGAAVEGDNAVAGAPGALADVEVRGDHAAAVDERGGAVSPIGDTDVEVASIDPGRIGAGDQHDIGGVAVIAVAADIPIDIDEESAVADGEAIVAGRAEATQG